MATTGVLRLPCINIELSEKLPERIVTIVLGGRAPDPAWLAAFTSGEIWAVDKGADVCRAAGLIPRKIIGDCDSARVENWRWAIENGSEEHLHPRDKDVTDFQLAMELLCDSGAGVLVTGGMGGRLDHMMANVSTFAWWAESCMPLCMADEREGILIVPSPGEAEVLFTAHDDIEALSLIPLSSFCTGVCISGVRWPLEDVILDRQRIWSISNRLAEVYEDVEGNKKSAVKLSCASGTLAFYWTERSTTDVCSY